MKASRSTSRLLPVDPGQLVVLAEPVVVALLSAAEFVSMADHRNALGEQQGGEEIALLARPQRVHLGIVGRSFVPQFHDRLWLSPSRLSSPLASLCFSL